MSYMFILFFLHISVSSSNACYLALVSKMKKHNSYVIIASKISLVPVSLRKTKLYDEEHTISKLVSFRENAELRCQVESANPLPMIVWRYKPVSCSDKSCDGPSDEWTRKFERASIFVFFVLYHMFLVLFAELYS